MIEEQEREKENAHDLQENILELLRQGGGLSFVPGLIQWTEERVRENVVEQFGSKDPTTADNKQRSPVLLKKHEVFEKT